MASILTAFTVFQRGDAWTPAATGRLHAAVAERSEEELSDLPCQDHSFINPEFQLVLLQHFAPTLLDLCCECSALFVAPVTRICC